MWKRMMGCQQIRTVHLLFGAVIILTIFFYTILTNNQRSLTYNVMMPLHSQLIQHDTRSAVNSTTSPISRKEPQKTLSPDAETNISYTDIFISATQQLQQNNLLLVSQVEDDSDRSNIMKIESKKVVSSPTSQLNSNSNKETSNINKGTTTNNTKTVTDSNKSIKTYKIYENGHLSDSSTINALCPKKGEALRLLILITSAPTHREQRLAIRQTWGHFGTRRDVSIGFVLGQTLNQPLEDQLSAENFMYNDLIRGHFIDSYNNLTLKTISLLEWVDVNCVNVSFVLKTDDDMFINVPKLLQFIEKHHKDRRTIFGRLAKKWTPIRNKKSKYYVSPEQYFPPIFPQFTTGPAYLMTSDIIHDLFTKSLNQTYLKLEDVYTTGIVAQLLNIKRINVNEFLNRRIAFNQCNIKKAISIHMVKGNEQFDLWKKLLDNNVKCK